LTRPEFLLTIVTTALLVEYASMDRTAACGANPLGMITAADAVRVVVEMG
jgi:hypothetical protein